MGTPMSARSVRVISAVNFERPIEISVSTTARISLCPLVLFTRDRSLMGELVNRQLTTIIASLVAAVIVGLNIFLLYQTFFGG